MEEQGKNKRPTIPQHLSIAGEVNGVVSVQGS